MLESRPWRTWHEWKTDLEPLKAENDPDRNSLSLLYLLRILQPKCNSKLGVLGILLVTKTARLQYALQQNQTVLILILSLVLRQLFNINTNGDVILEESRLYQAILLRLALALENRGTGKRTLNKSLKEIPIPTRLEPKKSLKLQTIQILI